ncbi:unnamed protein product [Euphydryas editha]|uniref:Nanos-type domain-containing protein n=1 Tax=Euphydryas editha TaxID=104508 RepID=A0AAU9UN93_EUPED|nr:unnamed protein product [Euphydryas editha]
MGLNNNYSDYGSGSSSESSPSNEPETIRRPGLSTFSEGSRSIDAIMQEFRLNGSDSPYDPEEETSNNLYNTHNRALAGMGPSNTYLRQKSWPAPDVSPVTRLPRPAPAADILLSMRPAEVSSVPEPVSMENVITEQQLQVLNSLPNSVLYSLLKELEQSRVQNTKGKKQTEAMECRFCKNNGERESYYRSHSLRARGRVSCPVLRAYRCRRCGARGDRAHTLKYCPLATPDERMKSTAMMRSVRMASGRCRNNAQVPSIDIASEYVVFGETTPTVLTDGAVYNNYETAPLDPIWEALEKKLML